MALETERCSPQNASSPGPNENTQNPGTNGGSCSGMNYSDNSRISPEAKSKSAFHQIALLTQKYTEPDNATECNGKPYSDVAFQNKPVSICSPLQNLRKDVDNYSPSPEHERGVDNEFAYKMSSRVQDYSKDDKLRGKYNGVKEPEIVQTLPYPCHLNKFNPELYISQIQNFSALPFNPFVGVFPARLPLKMQLYNTPNFNLPSDYMLGLQNAKLMCEVLQMQNLGFDRTRKCNETEMNGVNGLPDDTARPGVYSNANSDAYTQSRPDSPCSSVNSNSRYYSKNCSCSPSSKGVPSRSPSPNQMAPCAPLPFSVDNILRPEFGKTTALPAVKRSNPVKRNASPARKSKPPRCEIKVDETPMNTKTDSMSPRTADYDDQSSDKLTDDSSNEKDVNGKPWPAWVYCTRYSDRPSSGWLNFHFRSANIGYVGIYSLLE